MDFLSYLRSERQRAKHEQNRLNVKRALAARYQRQPTPGVYGPGQGEG